MKTENSQTFKKKIKDYMISYCPSEFYGKNLHGQLRVGYNKENKVVLFRINQLPLTRNLILFLQLQQHLSDLSGFSRTIHEAIHTSAHYYQPLQFFPRTFHSQINIFRSNSKYMDQYVEKFLRVYAFFFNMRVAHGNLSSQNIGITFQSRVKMMDFGINLENQSFQKRAQKDFYDFKDIISVILEKDSNFPSKFACFNNPANQSWQNLFGIWHITSPLQPLYFSRKSYIENTVTLLYKLYNQLQQKQVSSSLLFAIRLLQLKYLHDGDQQNFGSDREQLQGIVGKFQDWDFQKFNGVLIGAIQDPQYYLITPEHRLIIICCLIHEINHQYVYFQIVNEFNSTEKRRNQLLGDSLYITYRNTIFSNLLRLKPPKEQANIS